jgi:adenylate cyclase, class 2
MHINYEFKAKADDIGQLETLLLKEDSAYFKGEDHQIDTYFNVPQGRLKLREGNIEQALIFYERPDNAAAKQSNVILYKQVSDPALKQILVAALGIKIAVNKRRRIYFVDNVKFHFDQVEELGSFVEVEAIDKEGTIGIDRLREQCHFYASMFAIGADHYIAGSYSDLLLAKKYSNA